MDEQTYTNIDAEVIDDNLQKAIAKAEAKRGRLNQRRNAILKALEGTHNPFAAMYDATDKAIADNAPGQSGDINREYLKMTNRFYIFNFFEALLPYVRNSYVNDFGGVRHGMLTEGVLFNTDDPTKSAGMDVITNWDSKVLRTRLGQIEEQSKGKPEWVFWEGCRMKIPSKTTIVLSATEKQFIAAGHREDEQIVVNGAPLVYNTIVSGNPKPADSTNGLVTDLYKLGNDNFGDEKTLNREELEKFLQTNAKRFAPGSFINSKAAPEFVDPHVQNHEDGKSDRLSFGIVNDEKYRFTLVVPYENGFRNQEMSITVFSQDESEGGLYHIEELLTSSVL